MLINTDNSIAVGENAVVDFKNNTQVDYVIFGASFTEDDVQLGDKPFYK